MPLESRDLFPTTSPENSDPLRALLAETVGLELYTRICHWQVTGPQFRSLHGLFGDQAGELAEMADAVAERAQALGAHRLSSASELVAGANAPLPADAEAMLVGLALANRRLARSVRDVRRAAESGDDIATVSLSDGWLASGERRIWMLEASRTGTGR